MEVIPLARRRGRPRKTKGETIKKEANGFTIHMIHCEPLWRQVIHVVNPTNGVRLVVV